MSVACSILLCLLVQTQLAFNNNTTYDTNSNTLNINITEKSVSNNNTIRIISNLNDTGSCNKTLYELYIKQLVFKLQKMKISMVSKVHWYELKKQIEYIVDNNINGDIYETGIWRGGTSIFMYCTLREYEKCNKIRNLNNRNFYFFDSFNGFPIIKNDFKLYRILNDKRYVAELEDVQNNFKLFNALNDNVHFIRGYFEETIPKHTEDVSINNKIALLRLDGDLYSSTKIVLNNLYDLVVSSGYIIIDDYYWIPTQWNNKTKLCYHAVNEFMEHNNLNKSLLLKQSKVHQINYWQKP